MSDTQITKEERDARHGRYVARLPGVAAEGELVFTLRGPGLVSADHTGVPDAMGGRGIGKALIDAMIADARANAFRIVPYCPYVLAQYAKHPEWADAFATAPGEKPRRPV